MKILYKISAILLFLISPLLLRAQEYPAVAVSDTIYNPDIIYSPIPKVYEIAGIRVEGINHSDDYIIIGNSGLSIGEKVEVPGPILTAATKRLWRQGLYSSVKISADKIAGDKIWLRRGKRPAADTECDTQ